LCRILIYNRLKRHTNLQSENFSKIANKTTIATNVTTTIKISRANKTNTKPICSFLKNRKLQKPTKIRLDIKPTTISPSDTITTHKKNNEAQIVKHRIRSRNYRITRTTIPQLELFNRRTRLTATHTRQGTQINNQMDFPSTSTL